MKTLALLFVLAAPAGAASFGVRDVELGKVLDSSTKPETVSCYMGHCHGSVDVLDFSGDLTFYTWPDSGAIDDITLVVSYQHFDSLAAALTDKYGKPATSQGLQKQNGFGARVSSRVLAWIAVDGSTMVLDEHGSLTTSVLTIRSKQEPRKSAGI